MRAENGVFPSVCAFGDFYAILSVKKSAFGAHKGNADGGSILHLDRHPSATFACCALIDRAWSKAESFPHAPTHKKGSSGKWSDGYV